MEYLREEEQEEVQFNLNQIVWAKITGFPWWPAKITQVPEDDNSQFRVDFFSDNTHAFLSFPKIEKYQTRRHNIDMHAHMTKGLRKAIGAADEALEQQGPTVVSAVTPLPPVEVVPLNQKQLLQSPTNQTTLLQENLQLPLPIVNQQEDSLQQEQSQSVSAEQNAHLPFLKYSRQQRERFVRNLLNKYRLIAIPKTPEQQPPTKQTSSSTNGYKRRSCGRRGGENKTKRIGKLPHQRHTLSYLLSRKVNALLKSKRDLPIFQRKQISISLARQMLCGGGGPEELSRLFKWLTISPSPTIANFYDKWSSLQTDKEKETNMTNQE